MLRLTARKIRNTVWMLISWCTWRLSHLLLDTGFFLLGIFRLSGGWTMLNFVGLFFRQSTSTWFDLMLELELESNNNRSLQAASLLLHDLPVKMIIKDCFKSETEYLGKRLLRWPSVHEVQVVVLQRGKFIRAFWLAHSGEQVAHFSCFKSSLIEIK